MSKLLRIRASESLPHVQIRKNCTGISMIEVLVAIVIFAFGLLAIAGLQLAALKYQKGAWARAGSSTMATDLSERMRANIDAARVGNYQLTGSYSSLLASPPTSSGCDAKVTNCSSGDIAQNDLAEWAANLASTLPGGVGTLTGTQATGFIATVMWFDKDAVDANGMPLLSVVCASATVVTSTCCQAGTPAGVKCINASILP